MSTCNLFILLSYVVGLLDNYQQGFEDKNIEKVKLGQGSERMLGMPRTNPEWQ